MSLGYSTRGDRAPAQLEQLSLPGVEAPELFRCSACLSWLPSSLYSRKSPGRRTPNWNGDRECAECRACKRRRIARLVRRR